LGQPGADAFHRSGDSEIAYLRDIESGIPAGIDRAERCEVHVDIERDTVITAAVADTQPERRHFRRADVDTGCFLAAMGGYAMLREQRYHGLLHAPDQRSHVEMQAAHVEQQVGDELARALKVPGAEGDANLRSFMNWSDLEAGGRTAEILAHWRKLGLFRRAHPAVGAGTHRRLQAAPYVFSRTLETGSGVDRVVVAMDQGEAAKTIPVTGVFPDGTRLHDAYSGMDGTVRDGRISLTTPFGLLLLSEQRGGSVGTH